MKSPPVKDRYAGFSPALCVAPLAVFSALLSGLPHSFLRGSCSSSRHMPLWLSPILPNLDLTRQGLGQVMSYPNHAIMSALIWGRVAVHPASDLPAQHPTLHYMVLQLVQSASEGGHVLRPGWSGLGCRHSSRDEWLEQELSFGWSP